MLSNTWNSFGNNSLTCREQHESEEYLGTLLVTALPMDLTGEVTEARPLALQRVLLI